jgi:hypothetical protein
MSTACSSSAGAVVVTSDAPGGNSEKELFDSESVVESRRSMKDSMLSFVLFLHIKQNSNSVEH